MRCCDTSWRSSRAEDQAHQTIKDYLHQWTEHSAGKNPAFSILMRQCKVQNVVDKDSKKWMICMDLGEVADAVRSAVIATGAMVFEGAAPAKS